MVDRTKASYGDDSKMATSVYCATSQEIQYECTIQHGCSQNFHGSKADTTRQDSRVTEEKAPTIKLEGKENGGSKTMKIIVGYVSNSFIVVHDKVIFRL